MSNDEAEMLKGQVLALIAAMGAVASVVARDEPVRTAIEHKLRELDAQLVASMATDAEVAGGRTALALLLRTVQRESL